ncbi:MAG: Cytoplasmic GTPase/eEF2-like protein (ribosomal biogenesis) [Thelocarpon superellum]|nr:MAG: Cytoplasmic GTPase/eEF2-like protein (ribosomal biogenesis) [Thelocarpon superellum]
MPVVGTEKLIALQQKPEGIRNDHGKTSLTDALLATNGIISPKLAGKIRYLDSRPDEQLRGITMESSAISLYFSMLRRSQPAEAPAQREYLINLIDSPGHIDFSSEVSTASRLCDGALVLVDAVEGVCSQTVTVLRQTWIEHLQPLLVINKLDRLITELRMSPGEAYAHLSKLLEQVNAVVGSFFQGERMEEDLKWRERVEERVAATAAKEQAREAKRAVPTSPGEEADEIESTTGNMAGTFEEKDDEDIYFAPEKNNVIFSSAVDGWAFSVKQFAALYEKKLGIKTSVLEKILWGDYYLDPKTKRVLGQKHLKGRPLKPMFVQLVLETVWAVYEATTGGSQGSRAGNPTMLEKITKSLSITLPPHILRSKDPRAILVAVFATWLPLSVAVLVSVIEQLPSPSTAQASRLPALIDASPGAKQVDPRVRDAMVTLRAEKNEPVVVYVSKMVAIPESELPENRRRGGGLSAEEARELARKKRAEIARARAQAQANGAAAPDAVTAITDALGHAHLDLEETDGDVVSEEETSPHREHLVGFARIYSGTLSVGDQVYVLRPKFTPAAPHAHPRPRQVVVTALYLLMGRGLEPLQSVPAGVVFGIAGLQGHVLKTGTLCSQLEGGVNLAGVNMASQPIVRVALEPVNPSDLDKMIRGIQLLVQSDPCAEYEVLESGEHVILTAGELHLERCLKDLRERFAQCEIQAGEPLVPYRETIVSAAEMAPPRERDQPRGLVHGMTSSKQVTVRLRVRPLPATVTAFLEKHSAAIKRLYSENRAKEASGQAETAETDEDIVGEEEDSRGDGGSQILSPTEFKHELSAAFEQAETDRETWAGAVDQIVAFGPRRVGPNVLIDGTTQGCCRRFLGTSDSGGADVDHAARETSSDVLHARDFSDKISYAFQLATAQGPLCHEPMTGVAVILEDVIIAVSSAEDDTSSARDHLGRLTGEVIKTVRDSIRLGFLDWSPRLLLAMYSCEIQASTDVLGRVYAVLTRRRGRILSEALKEGTAYFTIQALLPVAESFGFSDEMRKRTSGAASPQLIFQGFEMLDQDPNWVPFTEEEMEDLGQHADRENVAKRYMDAVRARKGLFVTGRKLVKDAEKQKTLKR